MGINNKKIAKVSQMDLGLGVANCSDALCKLSKDNEV